MLASFRNIRNQSLFQNSFFLLGVNLFPFVIGFFFWGIASNLYPPQDIGLSSAIISATALIAGLAGPGFNLGLVRYLPEESNPGYFLNAIYTAIFTLSVFGSAIFLAGINLWSPGLIVLRKSLIYIVGFTAFVISINLGGVVRETFVARRKSIFSFWYTAIANMTRLILVLFGAHYGAIGLLASIFIGYLLALTIGILWFLPHVEKNFRMKVVIDWPIIKNIFLFSLGNYLANLLSQLPQTILPIMNLELLGAQASGYAFIPLMLTGALISPGLAISMSAFAEGANDPRDLFNLMKRASMLSLSIAFILTIISFWAAPGLLGLFGSGYVIQSTTLFRWLAALVVPMTMNHLYFTFLRLQKKTLQLTILSFMVAALNLIFSYMLIGHFGIAANGIGLFTGNVLLLIFLGAKFLTRNRYQIKRFSLEKP